MYFDSLQGWLAWQESLHPKAIDLGLERVGGVFRILNPESIKPPTITVAGTNGKGSCIAFLEAIYRAQGYRVGSYTSPHILKYNERIKIDGEPVDDKSICTAFERIESARKNTSLSYFEFGTLAALDIFWRAGLDVQLLEVGLGGRLDAVNIIDADATLITSICIDHCDWLGETREAIGREKAGIFRAGVPAIVGDPEPPVSLLQSAKAKSAPVFCIGKNFFYQKKATGWNWIAENNRLLDLPAPALKGEHQYRNAATVLSTISFMEEHLPVKEESVREGLSDVSLKGRFQIIEGEIPILLDVGHNPQAVRTLVDYIDQFFPNRRIHAIFSMMKDKDIKGVIEIMKPVVFKWYVSPLLNPRSATEQKMRNSFNSCNVGNVQFGFPDFAATMVAAKIDAVKGDLILVFGSFFLVSEFLAGIDKGE